MILKWLSKFWPVLVLIIFAGIVAWKNVIPETYLTGWDNLHPEFDFRTNIIDRGLKGVWQYYQGLGVPSGNAHVADLPRQIALWVASWVVPQNLIRYGYHLLAWLGGGIGAYYLLLRFLVGEVGYRKKQIAALVGSIFYLFNLGTLQNFYAPYEAFSHFYLMLPWLIAVLLDYLNGGTKRKLLVLILANLIAVPMAYIPTIFIVYMGVCGLVWLYHLLSSKLKNKLKNWRRVVVSGLVILVVNSFWLLPFIHFVAFNTKGVVEAKINRIFTQEAFLRNEEYGELKHSLLMEGFWFDTTDMTRVEGQHDFMMRPWMDYLAKPEVSATMWTLIALAGMGYLYGIVSRKKYSGLFLSITLLGLFALINTNWPTGEVFKYLQLKLPLFAQVLRFPFTKFIFLVIIGYSIGVVWFAEMIIKYLRWVGYLLIGVLVGGILYVQRPVFEGNFFYSNLRLKIPGEYFELFKFFQEEDRYRGRVANLPQPTFWGWTTYGWGYRGSGFPWYGIPQPILDRNFDVWSPESEAYYADLNNAIYDNENQEYFLKILEKYGVDYVWIDGWVINPQKPKLLDMTRVEEWLANGGYTQVYMNGKQIVYKRNVPIAQQGFKHIEENTFLGYPVVKLDQQIFGRYDYLRYGDVVYERGDLPKFIADRQSGNGLFAYRDADIKYFSISSPELNETYSFANEFPDLNYDERAWWLREIYVAYESQPEGKIEVCLTKGGGNPCYYIGVSDNPTGGYRWGRFELANTTSPREISFSLTGNVEMREIRFGYFNEGDELNITSYNNSVEDSIIFSLTKNQVSAKNCYVFGKGRFDREVLSESGREFVRYSAYDSSSCESMNLGDSEILAQGGEISIETRNIEGRPVKICLRHDPPGDCLVEEIVGGQKGEWMTNVFQIKPVTKLADLYLEIDNYAVGKENRVNDVGEVMIRKAGKVHEYTRELAGPVYTNNQAYRVGWVGLHIGDWSWKKPFGFAQGLRHVKVDGWANGWIMDKSQIKNSQISNWEQGDQEAQIVIIFYWPQLLQYLGLVMLGITVLGLWLPVRLRGR